MQRELIATGALDAVEARIQAWLDEAVAAIDAAELAPATRDVFVDLAERTARRRA
jgi:geranylgeranyl diphosphate synthase type I